MSESQNDTGLEKPAKKGKILKAIRVFKEGSHEEINALGASLLGRMKPDGRNVLILRNGTNTVSLVENGTGEFEKGSPDWLLLN